MNASHTLDYIRSKGHPVTEYIATGGEGSAYRMGEYVFKTWTDPDLTSHEIWKELYENGNRSGVAKILGHGYLDEEVPYTIIEAVIPLNQDFLEAFYGKIHRDPTFTHVPPFTPSFVKTLKGNMRYIETYGYNYDELAPQLGVNSKGKIVIFDFI